MDLIRCFIPPKKSEVNMKTMNLKQSVLVKAPATTANLGPGFDCLGAALDLWNTVKVQVGGSGIDIKGEGADYLDRGNGNLVYRSLTFLFKEIGMPVPPMAIACENNIPVSRGLGSSAAAVASGLVAANAICGDIFSTQELLKFAVTLEGHPDNVTAAILGGCRIVVRDGEDLIVASVPLAKEIRAVLFIPEQLIRTEKSREVLGPEVSRADALFNVGRVALLVNALNTGKHDDLRVATQDRLHQPQREVLFPAMRLIIKAGLEAGAVGAFLSGSGSTIIAMVRDHEMTVSYEIADMAAKKGIPGELRVVEFSQIGTQVTHLE